MHFYKDKEHSDKSIAYIFIEEEIIIGIHREKPPFMKTRKKLFLKKLDYYCKNCLMKVGKKLIQDGGKYF